jgi:hypothetical protein
VKRIAVAVVAGSVVLLAACGQSTPSGDAGDGDKAVGGVPGAPPKTQYDLANGCFALKPESVATFAAYAGEGYAASAGDSISAIHFFMKATGLGSYMFSAQDGQLMTAVAGALPTDAPTLAPGTEPGPDADWAIEASDKGIYTIRSLATGHALAVGADNALVLADAGSTFEFLPSRGCTEFPEMPTGIEAAAFKQAAGQPVIGFAEVHAHMAMGSEMSDGSRNVGPSAGGVMYGHAVNRYGVSKALENCSGPHGENGELSPEWLVLDGGDYSHAQHDTVGWPTFAEWPQRDSQLHQQMYWRWVERAYKAGLRLMTVHGTNIEALCDVAKNSGNDKDADLMDTDCTDMGVGVKQVEYLSDMESYIDAQNGGPGKGWFRIVASPAEARAVIADGKLAVVPGLEFSNMFGCKVEFLPDGTELPGCTKEQIDEGVERVWELGVRQIITFHDVDSALGGAGIFSSVLNLINFAATHQFWQTYPCPDGGEGPTYFYEAGAVMESAPLTSYGDPISQALVENAEGRYPIYGPGRQCNARGTTELGFYALNKLMDRGFVLDIDHAELSIKQDMLDLGAQRTPDYPMLSAHGGHGGISMAQARQMLEQGGLIYPSGQNGEGYKNYLDRVKAIWPAGRPLAMGYGADANGLANQFTPRGAGSTPVEYPFTLFKGEGWGPQFAAADIKPVKVEMLSIPGGQSWNADEVGAANYGMIADMVEQVRIEGGEEATTALFNSAEAYLRMWEQTLEASGQ